MNGILNESTAVKQFDFNKPDIHENDYLRDDIIEDWRNKCFHTFEYRLFCCIIFTNISDNDDI